MKKIVAFEDGTFLAFTTGSFDDFRVSFFDNNEVYLFSPTDIQLFNYFLSLKNNEKVWEIALKIANQINSTIEYSEVIIYTLSNDINEKKYFSALAAAMIAEERKKGTILKKRIKLLGLHQVLLQGITPQIAANWSKHKPWRIIDQECKKFGI